MKRRNKSHDKRSFNEILKNVATANANRLMRRASLANSLAKSLRGKSRFGAYAVKSRALVELTNRFPERLKIIRDFRIPRFVLVKARRLRFGLHAPAALFETEVG